MIAKQLTPILNVSNMHASFDWFEKLGWTKSWEWGNPVGFGGVRSGDTEIFLCLNGQGGRGKGTNRQTFGEIGADRIDAGMWISVWVEDVDEVHRHCLKNHLEVTWPPADMPWNVREMHIRHPDGHVFRISHPLHGDSSG